MAAIVTPQEAKQGLRAGQRNALERIAFLEQSFNNMVAAIQESFQNNDRNVAELIEVVGALVRITSPEQVASTMNDIRNEKLTAEADAAKARLAEGLKTGELVDGTTVTTDSVVTGIERNEDGTDVVPGYVQLEYASVKPEYQTKLLGTKAGDKFETENKRTFEVTGVYNKNPNYVKPEEKKPASVTLDAAESKVEAAN